MVGEAAISTATLCFGDSMNGNNGHADTDVLYIAFTGTDAVPGAEGADWAATSADEFESSLETLGNKLLQRIASSGGSSNSTPSATTDAVVSSPAAASTSGSGSSGSCSWAGHCAGKTAPVHHLLDRKSFLAHAGVLIANMCAGAACSTDDDCSDEMTCSNGQCS